MFRLIASYPKSGNTYVRILLANYMRGEKDLNKIGFPIFSSRAFFPIGVPRDRRTIRYTENIEQPNYSKTHEVSRYYYGSFVDRAIYIIRNPVDVIPSWARHMSCDLNKSILSTSRDKWLHGNGKMYAQHIGSWTTNVRSWLNHEEFPIHYVRYESLVSDPAKIFKGILEFLDIPYNEHKFIETLRFTAFDNLKKLEQEQGFKEARGSTGKFFNVGKSGNGKELLTPEQIQEIKRLHGPTMALLGYA